MLYSREGNIAFAAYPKTASTAVASWFQERFPDACYVDPQRPHMPVHVALESLGLVDKVSWRPRLLRESLKVLERGLRAIHDPSPPCDLRIIGVVRDPFDMLVSLYKYWRRTATPAEDTICLVRTAVAGSFRDFFKVAIVRRRLPKYERFFDFRGPAWGGTRLLRFDHLEAGLTAVSQEFGIQSAGRPLRVLNADPAGRSNVDDYRREVEDLLPALFKRFRWYYSGSYGAELAAPETCLLHAA